MRQCSFQRVVIGLDLILNSRLYHQHNRVEVVAELSQVEVIEFLVVVLQLSKEWR